MSKINEINVGGTLYDIEAKSYAGTLPIANGGTGATTAADALTNIGAAASSHSHAAVDITSGTLPIARGGTNATTAAAARSSLGIVNLECEFFNVGDLTFSSASVKNVNMTISSKPSSVIGCALMGSGVEQSYAHMIQCTGYNDYNSSTGKFTTKIYANGADTFTGVKFLVFYHK